MKRTGVSAPAGERFDRVDALRGVAMLWMTVFHFCFDLSHFGYGAQNFLVDPFWTLQRTGIVRLFLFCAGLGQAIAVDRGQGWGRFGKRWVQIGGCALLVTAGSMVMFPRSFIYFGVLHGMAIMLLVARSTTRWQQWLWLLGSVALVLPWLAHWALSGPLVDWAGAFNSPALNWLGLISQKPYTEDYVPLLPWLGVMWWGMAAGQYLLAHQRPWLQATVPCRLRPLALLGRWSLSYYMLHQPVLMGLLLGVAWVVGRAA